MPGSAARALDTHASERRSPKAKPWEVAGCGSASMPSTPSSEPNAIRTAASRASVAWSGSSRSTASSSTRSRSQLRQWSLGSVLTQPCNEGTHEVLGVAADLDGRCCAGQREQHGDEWSEQGDVVWEPYSHGLPRAASTSAGPSGAGCPNVAVKTERDWASPTKLIRYAHSSRTNGSGTGPRIARRTAPQSSRISAEREREHHRRASGSRIKDLDDLTHWRIPAARPSAPARRERTCGRHARMRMGQAPVGRRPR